MTSSSAKAAVAGPRSAALIGPYGSGKSTLFDALMAAAGTPVKRPIDPRKRVVSTELRLGHCSFLGDRWSILDCPGSVEFTYETEGALAAVDLAIVVVEPMAGRTSSVALLLKSLENSGLPHLIFVNKIDTLTGPLDETLAALQAYSKYPLAPRQLPIRENEAVVGYIDVVSKRAYRYGANQAAERIEIPAQLRDPEKHALDGLAEVLADQDDALLEKLIEEVEPTASELYQHLHKDQASGTIVEVFFGSAARGQGIFPLWKAMRHDVPDAAETASHHGIAADGEPLVQIFKTLQAGKFSYGRIWRGVLRDGATFDGVRVGGIQRFPGGETVRVPEADAGELVALGRLEGVATGAVLGTPGAGASLPYPSPRPAGLCFRDRGQRPQGRCQAFQRLAQNRFGGPGPQRRARSRNRRDGFEGARRNPSQHRHRTSRHDLQSRDHHGFAKNCVQGNNPAQGAPALEAQTANRRAWPIRRHQAGD